MFCLLFFFGAWEALKKLGDSPSCLPRKKPFPPKFPRNRRSDGGRFVVEQSCTTPTGSLITPSSSELLSRSHPCGNNSESSKFPSNPPCSSSCGSILIQIHVHRSSDQRLQEISALTVRCDSSSLDKINRLCSRLRIVYSYSFLSTSQTRDLDSSSCWVTSYITSHWLHFYLFLHPLQTLLDLPKLGLICPHNRRVLSFNLGSVLSLT